MIGIRLLRVMTLAALSGPLPKLGEVVVALIVGYALVAARPRDRAAATVGALVLAPALLLTDIWTSPQLTSAHRHPLLAVAGAAAGLGVVALLALAMVRRPWLVAALAIA